MVFSFVYLQLPLASQPLVIDFIIIINNHSLQEVFPFTIIYNQLLVALPWEALQPTTDSYRFNFF
jgi:hypothetical protein